MKVAIIGSGPRGVSVLERMAARLAEGPVHEVVEIHLIDSHRVGTGRIWRTDQPRWFLMNTVADEVSAFSGPPDGGPARPGAGPSLAQWWSSVDPEYPGPNSYAPRALHGRYMRFLLDAIEKNLPERVRLIPVHATVDALERTGDGYRLTLRDGSGLTVDRVVLTTGHTTPELTGNQRRLAAHAARHPGLRHIAGDSAADMPLDEIPAGSAVGVLGLGLSFYDVMAALTEGRGGHYDEDGGRLVYRPTGSEPVIVAGSRSGMPLPGRGRNQKHHDHRHRHVLFTTQRVLARGRHGALSFADDALPWLLAEVELVYYATTLTARGEPGKAAAFEAEVVAAAESGVPDVPAVAAGYGLGDVPRIDLDAQARPFAGRHFAGPEEFTRALTEALAEDLAHADAGNVDDPLKAALDVIRDSRAVIRSLVDFAGLTPVSHREEFLGWYVPRSSFLAAGPPRRRLRQADALLRCGVLRVVGPDTRLRPHPSGRFSVHSPYVSGSEILVDTVIDARVPTPDMRLDPHPLTRSLREQGIWTSYVNHGTDGDRFDTGGVAVTGAPFHPVDRAGRPDRGLYVLGIPTEHTRWFMQGGSSRPGFWTDFVQNADAVAADIVAPALAAAPPLPARTG
ncbi:MULTISPECIES: FAD/NAD(P)-binding protein [Streptomyces]|uniref:FAD/NAD(P)-binding protein n=1 Tax=Streptomyces TaxID=1883 RepID=UPI0029B2E340|nr:FAD/NAD(P)-binding protein [Streptomyces sp. WI03-4A]MDX2590844.1 FAD/NAD(P)-binding protein [Streptomyces sp. WI03-4A]